MMIDPQGPESIHEIINDIFERYAPQAPEYALRNIENRSGILLQDVTVDNIDDFLLAMKYELVEIMEEWKAKFIIGVIRQMVIRGL
jgi:hypothetical protein